MKKLCLSSVALFIGFFIQAQTYYTRISGAWNNTTDVWSTVSPAGSACLCDPGTSLSGTKAVNVSHNITATTLTSQAGSSAITVESGDSLTITTSTFTMSDNAVITVNAGGILIIHGNINSSGSAKVLVNGTLLVYGNVSTSGSASYSGAGIASASGTVTGPNTSMISVLPPSGYTTNTTYGGITEDGACGGAVQGAFTQCFTNANAVNNTGFGSAALGDGSTNERNQDNTGIGAFALTGIGLGTASFNTGVGTSALQSTINGQGNTGVGSGAIEYLTGGVVNQNNTAIGWDALQGPPPPAPAPNYTYNTAIGAFSLTSTTIGISNSAVGEGTLQFNQGGNGNSALGYQAMYGNGGFYSTAAYNIALGYQAMYGNIGAIDGTYNIATGYQAMYGNVGGISNTCTYNIATGYQAMYGNDGAIDGSYNIANGYQAMYGDNGIIANTSQYNIATGYQALYGKAGAINGAGNIASGYQAMYGSIGAIDGTDNIATGVLSLYRITGGNNNIATGYEAMYGNTPNGVTGGYNIATGYQALDDISSGANNIAIGYQAMYGTGGNLNPITGYYNAAIGYQALYDITTGYYNTAIGYQALYDITTGYYNTAEGYKSLYSNKTGYYNVAIGYQALLDNAATYSLTAVGSNALENNAGGGSNTALGFSALVNNVGGSYNTASGYEALNNNTASDNTGTGYEALYTNGAGEYNTADGLQALYYNTTSYNTATGANAMYGVAPGITGGYNTADGYSAMYYITTGTNNTAQGYYAIGGRAAGIVGTGNTGSGYKTLDNITGGNYNTANGYEAMYGSLVATDPITGNYNAAVGYQSLYNIINGIGNTAVGSNAMRGNNSGSGNAALGDSALISNTTGSYNTAIGNDANVAAGTYTNTTAVGYDAITAANNQMELGNNNSTVTIGASTIAPTAPVTKLEIRTDANAVAPFNVTAADPSPVAAAPAKGWSGLRFDDLEEGISTPGINPGTGVLTVDANGNVIYVNETGGIGTCANPTILTAANGAINMNNVANFYFAGNGSGSLTNNDVLIGYNCTVPNQYAKLSVLQNSGAASTATQPSTGIYVENDDQNSGLIGAPIPLIGIESHIPAPTINPCAYSNVAGWFEADEAISCLFTGAQQYAIFVPGEPTDATGGIVSIGFPFPTSTATYMLQVNGYADLDGTVIPSDSNLKTNITPFTYGIKAIRNLNPISYNYNGIGGFNTTNTNIGLLAQNLQRNVPNGVKSSHIIKDTITHDTATILNIYEEAVLYTAINAIKEVDSTVTRQQLTIDSLRGSNNSDSIGTDSLSRITATQTDAAGTLYNTSGSTTTQMPAAAANAFYSTSDIRCKTNITNIPNALSLVENLNGVYFKWNQAAYPWKNFPSGQQIGFIAQQVDTVVPQVVIQNDSGYYNVDYGRITPLLVDAMKQQQQTIDSLKNVLNSIQACLNSICDSSHYYHHGAENSGSDNNTTNVQEVTLSSANAPLLYQNTPNPFSTGTKINYYLPQGTQGATIVFYDTYGNQIKQVQLSQTGNGTLNITPDNLTSGIYSYSLIVNGTVIDTKRMVLQK